MKAMLAALGAHLPRYVPPLERGLILLPPLTAAGTQLDLDYASLLLFDGVVLDRSCYEFAREHCEEDLQLLVNSISQLVGEGYAELVDYKPIAERYHPEVSDVGEKLAQDFALWLPALREDILTWRTDLAELLPCAPKSLSPLHGCGFAVGRFLIDTEGRIDLAHAASLDRLIFARRKRYSISERQTLKRLVQPCIEMVHLNLLLARELSASNIADWAQTKPYYQVRARYHLILRHEERRQANEVTAHVSKFQELFSLGFPQFSPRDATEFLRMVRDPRIEDLRNHVAEACERNIVFDANYAHRALQSMLASQTKVKRWRQFFGYAMWPVDLLPTFGGGRLVETTTNAALERRQMKEHRWLYFTYA